MRVLFALYAEKTHLFSMVPLAWALQAAGHEVRIASQPELAPTITATGLTAVPVGKDHSLWRIPSSQEVARSGRIPPFHAADLPDRELRWEYLESGYASSVRWWLGMVNDPLVEGLTRLALSWRPDLVVWEQTSFAGAIAAEACGAAHARTTWAPDFHGRLRDRYLRLKAARPEGQRDDPLQEWLTRQAQRFGVPYSERLVRGHFTIEQLPEAMSWNTGPDYLRMRYVPYNGQAVVPDWLRSEPERPRIALSLGRSATDRSYGYSVPLAELLGRLHELDAEVVATASPQARRSLGPLPDNVRVVDFVPLLALLPTCSAVIHHGGFGSMATAMLAGVPQLVLSQPLGGSFMGDGLARYGAGLHTPSARASGPEVAASVRGLLTEPRYRRRAAELRAEALALPSPAGVVPELEARSAGPRTTAVRV